MTWHCFLWKRHTSSLGFRLFSEMFRFHSRLWISGLHTLHTVCFPHQWTESFRILYDFWRCSTLRQSAWDYRRKQWSNTYTIRGRHFHPWYHDQNCKYAPVINHSYSSLQIYHYASHPLRRSIVGGSMSTWPRVILQSLFEFPQSSYSAISLALFFYGNGLTCSMALRLVSVCHCGPCDELLVHCLSWLLLHTLHDTEGHWRFA